MMIIYPWRLLLGVITHICTY